MSVQSGNTAEIQVGNLFETERLPQSSLEYFLFIIYFPFGILLFILRLFIGLHVFLVSCILPKGSKLRKYILRVMLMILGCYVHDDGHTNTKARVFVSNHQSLMDHLIIDLVQSCYLPSVWNLPSALAWALGYIDLGARLGRSTLIERTKQYLNDATHLPILAFPEGAMTSGRVGLLRFNCWPFSLNYPVQPICLTVIRPPFARVKVSVLGSRWWTDLFWFLFVPYTYFTVNKVFLFDFRWLPVVEKGESEDVDVFSKKVAQLIANQLSLSCTNFSSQDAVDYAKRRLLDQRREQQERKIMSPNNKNAKFSSHQLDTMTLKVKEMFPVPPLAAIRRDIEKTRSIEATCTNILEGHLKVDAFDSMDIETVIRKVGTEDASCYQSIYDRRKWCMIEQCRGQYLKSKQVS